MSSYSNSSYVSHDDDKAVYDAEKVFVSITVDDLEARGNPERSDRIACYKATPEEIGELLLLIRRLRAR